MPGDAVPFRPALVPTVALLGALFILVNLGLWQLRRHHGAEAQRAVVEARLYGAPITAANLDADADALAWHKAVLSGRFLTRPSQLVAGRTERGEPGYDVVQVLQTDGGPAVLVNRGWIPAEGWQAHLDAIQTDGTTQVEGLLQPLAGAGSAPGVTVRELPAEPDRPARWPQGQTTWLGIVPQRLGPPYEAIAAATGLDLAPVYLVAGPALVRGQSKQGDLPLSGYVAEPRSIGHFEYAMQWFLIALTAVCVWGWASYQRGKRLASGGEGVQG